MEGASAHIEQNSNNALNEPYLYIIAIGIQILIPFAKLNIRPNQLSSCYISNKGRGESMLTVGG